MKVKKFTCISCGAPKVNPYKSPYIVCDYCGSFTDIDFALVMDLWNERTEENIEFVNIKTDYANRFTNAFENDDRQEYLKLQREYWLHYYKAYPYYVPPSLDNEIKFNT